MFTTVEEFQKFSKGQFEAATQAATALSNGMQQMLTEAADFSKQSVEAGSAAWQTLLSSRSVESAVQHQIDYAKSAYESAVAESTKVSQLVSTTTQNVFAPIENALAMARTAFQGNSAA